MIVGKGHIMMLKDRIKQKDSELINLEVKLAAAMRKITALEDILDEAEALEDERFGENNGED